MPIALANETYDIRINEFQRSIFLLAMREFVQKHRGSHEHSHEILVEAMMLDDLLTQTEDFPLYEQGINDFTM
jgi:hypothetical protein